MPPIKVNFDQYNKQPADKLLETETRFDDFGATYTRLGA